MELLKKKSYPDQETAVAVGGRVVARHAVCLRPDDAEARKFRGPGGGGGEDEPRRPRLREDGWWEVEMGIDAPAIDLTRHCRQTGIAVHRARTPGIDVREE
ncbi:phloem-specific lectin [Panicum miliaceum]|uniref:Phloem-specific lectin n=1 Tax=Panicum miliaceum TaxID=4540 RepID=A0A3L6PP80_PANMI|nr:phloem-specific lectin [Panicum miliaceum]